MPQHLRVNLHEVANSTDHANTFRILFADVEHHPHGTFHDLGRIPALSGHVATSKPFGAAGQPSRTATYWAVSTRFGKNYAQLFMVAEEARVIKSVPCLRLRPIQCSTRSECTFGACERIAVCPWRSWQPIAA